MLALDHGVLVNKQSVATVLRHHDVQLSISTIDFNKCSLAQRLISTNAA